MWSSSIDVKDTSVELIKPEAKFWAQVIYSHRACSLAQVLFSQKRFSMLSLFSSFLDCTLHMFSYLGLRFILIKFVVVVFVFDFLI